MGIERLGFKIQPCEVLDKSPWAWLMWWDTSKSHVTPEKCSFLFAFYRIRQAIKENFLLTLVLTRTSPTGQIRAVLSSRKQRDQSYTQYFFSCALKFLSLSSLRSFPIQYTNQGGAELFPPQQIWNIKMFCKKCLSYPLYFTSTQNQPQYSSQFWNLEKCQVSGVTKTMALKNNTKYYMNVVQLVLYYFVLKLLDSELNARTDLSKMTSPISY